MAVPKSVTLYKANTQYIEIDGLQDGLTGINYNAATVTATLTDSTGTVVPQVNNLTLSFVTGSLGIYRGTVDATFDPTPGSYSLEIVAVQGSVTMTLLLRAMVAVRTQ